MIVGIPKETFPGEARVALVPAVLAPLKKAGCEFLLEAGAGVAAGYPDAMYTKKGVRIVASRDELFRDAGIIAQVRAYGANPEAGRDDIRRMRPGQVIVGHFEPLTAGAEAQEVAATGATLFAMELIPRISRAQSMDVLSSMATIAGYKAVLLAADTLPKMFPMMMTAAGTISPARVFIVGAGVAGLQAIATARKLGGVVDAYDVRPAVKEQVESLGAKFVEMQLDAQDSEDKGGYAKAQDEAFYRKQREMMGRVITRSDVVITTAAIPGRKAPLLVTAAMVAGMAPGSVIVDLAAERGGNCELTRAGETVVEHGVTILGPLNLPALVPYHASQMYAKNVATFLQLLIKDGTLNLNRDDEIIRETLVTHDGNIENARIRDTLTPSRAAAGAAGAREE